MWVGGGDEVDSAVEVGVGCADAGAAGDDCQVCVISTSEYMAWFSGREERKGENTEKIKIRNWIVKSPCWNNGFMHC